MGITIFEYERLLPDQLSQAVLFDYRPSIFAAKQLELTSDSGQPYSTVEQSSVRPAYSLLKARIGSTPAARRAGR
jgi:hypothetical protein